jgi:hypothetical protein
VTVSIQGIDPPNGLGGFDPDCRPRRIAKAAKQETQNVAGNLERFFWPKQQAVDIRNGMSDKHARVRVYMRDEEKKEDGKRDDV